MLYFGELISRFSNDVWKFSHKVKPKTFLYVPLNSVQPLTVYLTLSLRPLKPQNLSSVCKFKFKGNPQPNRRYLCSPSADMCTVKYYNQVRCSSMPFCFRRIYSRPREILICKNTVHQLLCQEIKPVQVKTACSVSGRQSNCCSHINGNIGHPGSYSQWTCHWLRPWFGKRNVTENKLVQ
jgi:hypothetical protein